MTNAVVLAGGRITGWFARASGTTIKALVPVRGQPLLRWVLDALAATPEVGTVCVVGPAELAAHLTAEERLVLEVGSVLQNLRVGLAFVGELNLTPECPPSGVRELASTNTTVTAPPDSGTSAAADASAAALVPESHPSMPSPRPQRLCGSIPERVLVVGADLGTVTPKALSDLLARAPGEAELCLPLVRKERFQAVFPGNFGIYVRLADGAFTSGGQVLVDPAAIERNAELLQRMFDRRKSQLAMAHALGPRFIGRLISGRLAVAELEERATELTGCVCRAVPDCDPLLAFDVDNVFDARYLQSWRGTSSGAE